MAMSDIIPWRSSRGELTRRGDPLSYVQSQINRMFDDLWSGAQWPAETGRMFSPQVEIKETEKEIQVCAELPGIESKDLRQAFKARFKVQDTRDRYGVP